ncbi:MAG TPA: hypothetical protein IAD14_07985 [Candidatus Coprousia avicola]|nr:hypothetical protein [Candidatus Coprousia avicola]
MSWFDNLVGERESEFTGLKGAILRYAGNAYTLVLVGLFFLAFAEAYPAAAVPLRIAAGISFVLAVIIRPLKTWLRDRQSVGASRG